MVNESALLGKQHEESEELIACYDGNARRPILSSRVLHERQKSIELRLDEIQKGTRYVPVFEGMDHSLRAAARESRGGFQPLGSLPIASAGADQAIGELIEQVLGNASEVHGGC